MKFQKLYFKIPQIPLCILIILIISLSWYYLILSLGLPEPINQFFLETNYLTGFILVIFTLLYLAYLPNGWLGIFTSFTATLTLFAGQLAGLWNNLVDFHYTLSGFFPFNDANFYYISSLKLLEGKPFHPVGSWRPLSHAAIGNLLGLTQQNLQLTITILVLFIAISCFFLAREVQSSHGTVAGVLVLTVIFMFIKPFIGTLGTENLGFVFGAVGLTMLWRGLHSQRKMWWLGGLFILTFGLNIRAGTYFILPAFGLLGAWLFRHKSKLSFNFLMSEFTVIFLGFLLNSLIFKLVAFPGAEANGNFSVVLYGMAVEGSWVSFSQDYPEIQDTNEIYRLAFQAIWADPLVLVRSFWRASQAFFKDGFLFSFIKSSQILIVLQVLSLVSFFYFYRQRRTLITWFMLAGFLGILFSLPFVPPWDAGIRVYATTIPFVAIFPALGLAFIVNCFSPLLPKKIRQSPHISSPLAIFAVGLVLLITMGTVTTKILSYQPKFSQISCPSDTEIIYFRNSQGSSINLVADKEINKNYIPNIRISDFKHDILPQLNSPEMIKIGFQPFYKALDSLTVDTTIMAKIALPNPNQQTTSKQSIQSGDGLWIIAKKNLFPQKNGIVGACGKYLPLQYDGFHGKLFFADSMKLVK
ncbi:hypothetical protein [Crocosphaera sp.]|uniref:hypothetical protein n=1 Tax=Crocosphaera sp. TaxID=2729996 RepID=UPI00261393BE|nr:hypothetical protein [Crocosphaera sp.]MDJ0579625.1 hypothetical protein [Crocosphaera sp.]